MPHRLLLADDSVTIQRVIELTFADEDIEVIAVGDGAEAIRRIESDRPDIVLADVGMPEKDGYEVAAFVKHTPHLQHIPVLLLTGAFEPVDERRAQEVGCDGVLAKPFEPQLVITRVNELLREAPPPRAAAVVPPVVAPHHGRADDPAPVESAPPVPLSPLDAFLAAAPAIDLDAYSARPRASIQQPQPAVSTVELSAERDPAPAPVDVASGVADAPMAIVDAPAAVPDALAAIAVAPAVVVDAPPAIVEPPRALDPVVDEPPPEPSAADPSAVRISRRTPIAVPGFGAPALPPASTTAELDEYFEKLDAAFATLQQTPAKPEPPRGPTAPGPVLLQASDAAPAIAQAFSALLAAEHGQILPVQPVPVIEAPELPPAVLDELVDRVTRDVLERLSDRVVRDTVTDIVSRVAEKLVREEIDRVKATIK